MNAFLSVVFDHFKLRVRDDHIAAVALWLSVNNEPMSLNDHFLHPVRIKPPANEPPAECTRAVFLDEHVEHFLPATNPADARLFHHTANANRLIGGVVREAIELVAILVATREVQKQRPDRG